MGRFSRFACNVWAVPYTQRDRHYATFFWVTKYKHVHLDKCATCKHETMCSLADLFNWNKKFSRKVWRSSQANRWFSAPLDYLAGCTPDCSLPGAPLPDVRAAS